MNRIISLLSIIFFTCLVSEARDFSYTYEGQTLVYTVLDENAKTCETKAGKPSAPENNVSGRLILPEKVMDGNTTYTLTRIGDLAFNNCKGLMGPLTIPNSVTSIGVSAFHDCKGLTGSLTIPNSVTSIDSGAFSGCSGFTGSLTIPNTVTSIGGSAFRGCSGLSGPLTIPNYVTSIEYEAFMGCSGLTGPLTIPNTVTSIGSGAFSECSRLSGPLTIPNSVKSIGSEAFSECSGFTGPLTIPNSVTSIGSGAFNGCFGFTGPLTIPNSVTSIGEYAFCGCSGLTGPLTIPNSVTSIDKGVFEYCKCLTGPLTISNSVTSIGSGAFHYCENLMGPLTIPNSVTSIGDRAFEGCSGLTGPLTIPNSVTSIGSEAFFECSALTGSLTISNSLTSISYRAFRGCSGLTGPLTIPNSVTSIDYEAFEECSGLTGPLTIPNSVTSIGRSAFWGCSGLTGSLTIPNTLTSISDGAFNGCSGLTGSLTIPNSVTSIGSDAFSGCSGLTGPLTIPNSVTLIGNRAFSGCSGLTGPLTIPNSVISIGSYAFYSCFGLTELRLPENLKKIGSYAFSTIYYITRRDMNIERVYSEAKTPPLIGSGNDSSDPSFYSFTTEHATLIMPNESIELYKSSYNWKDFINIKGDSEVIAVSIELDKTTASLKATETVQLTATVLPEDATDKSVTWTSSDSEIATVDSEGLVTAVSVGTATITATSSNGLTATCAVEVIETPAGSIELNKTTVSLKATETVQLSATVLPETTSDKSVTWTSSDSEIATVDSEGLVTAVSVGTATITATSSNGLTATCAVEVIETPAGSIELNKTTVSLKATETVQLTATVMPETTSDKSVSWTSSDSEIATVDSEGLVTAVSVGTATITATSSNGLTATCAVEVIATPAGSIELNKTTVSLKATETVQLSATVLPDDATDRSVTWSSSDPSVVSVDETGLVTAINVGSAVVTATTSNGLSAECLVEVIETPASEVIIDKESLGIIGDDLEMRVGEVRTINVTVLPETATDKSVGFESSDPTVASVDSDGILRALSLGNTTVTITAKSGVSASFNVIVVSTPVETVTLNRTEASLKVSEHLQLAATVLPEDATDRSVTWSSSDPSVVSVDETGLVTAENVGSAVVTATTSNGLSAECLVEVIETPASEVIIDKESLGISGDDLEMRVGEIRTISVTVLPETATDKSVGFESSDPTVASVDSDGILMALSLGNTTVTITAKSGVSASFNVIVVATPVESVTLNRTEASLKVSEHLQLTATVLPEDATDRSVTWSSSDPSVVSVDETGLVTAMNVGSAVVAAITGNGLSAECHITVTETPVSEVIIDKESLGISGDDLELIVGEVRTINVTVLPETATDKSVSFRSSNQTVASVDDRGVLTALTPGNTTITITARSGVSTSIHVIVKNPTVSSVATSVSPLKVREGCPIHVSADRPQGGYESGWEWSWSIDGDEVSRDLEFDYKPEMTFGLEPQIDEIRFVFHAVDRNQEGTVISEINESTDYVSVYRRPQTPLQLLRKGDGSSRTLIAMAGLDDQRLKDLEYLFVYGYTDRHGIDYIIETTPSRYCRTIELIYNNPDIKLWVYSVWKYDDGSVVSSGRRYLDGMADEEFDASEFNGRSVRSTDLQNPETWMTLIDNGIEVNMTSTSDSRIEVFDMHGRVILSRSVKAGVSYFETLVFDRNDGNMFMVRIVSGRDSVVKKIIVR